VTISAFAPGVVLGLSRNLDSYGGPPRIFARHPGLLVPDGGAVAVDPTAGRWIAEGELALVVGAEVDRVDERVAARSIAGWTIADDVTALDRVAVDGYSQEAKGVGTPILPRVVEAFAADEARIQVSVNGELVAEGPMSRLRLRGAALLAWVSQTQHLLPGDVILCGAPGTAAPVAPGDEVVVVVSGVGTLSHRVIAVDGQPTIPTAPRAR